MLDKITAEYIWNCIQDHCGDFSEDRGEWLWAMNISESVFELFENMITQAIDALPEK